MARKIKSGGFPMIILDKSKKRKIVSVLSILIKSKKFWITFWISRSSLSWKFKFDSGYFEFDLAFII